MLTSQDTTRRRLLPHQVRRYLVLFAVALLPALVTKASTLQIHLPLRIASLERPLPADTHDPMLVELGRLLFFDPRLSGDSSTACATCHDPSAGWAFPQDLSKGYPMTSNWRNSPTVVNSGFLNSLFWDGRSASLEAQAQAAMTSPIEGNGHQAVIVARLAHIPEYVRRFADLFGTPTPQHADIWRAIAAFERTLVDADTPFDRYMRGETAALTASAKRGLQLFTTKARCTRCHNGDLLTDQGFHVTGVPPSEHWTSSGPAQVTFRFKTESAIRSRIELKFYDDPGRFLVTANEDQIGAFRTAPLRHTLYTAPYMHNGAFWTLRDVVEFYNAGGMSSRTELLPLGLSEQEITDLVSFLEALSGPELTTPSPGLPQYEEPFR